MKTERIFVEHVIKMNLDQLWEQLRKNKVAWEKHLENTTSQDTTTRRLSFEREVLEETIWEKSCEPRDVINKRIEDFWNTILL